MKENRIYIALLTAVTAALLFLLFQPVLQHPNSILFSKSVDPLKSYFNFSYYLKYDSGIRHDGINYPYGDHLQYINSHPVYVSVLKLVDRHIYPIANYGVGILNLTMIFSFLMGMPLLFLILRRFKLPSWYAMLMALLIGFLTPQFDRIHGHFEMVYWFFIPLFWYLLLRFREDDKPILWGSLLVLSGTISGFISAYYVAFYLIFLVAVLLSDLWLNRKLFRQHIKPALYLFVLAVLPVLLVKGLVGATDWVDDRPDNPYGFYVYHANLFSIFLPSEFPLKDFISKYIDLGFQWEGRAFVGLPATLVAISLVLLAPIAWIRKRQPDWSFFLQHKPFRPYLLAGTLVLLFAMCFPFKWGFGFLLELLPPVRQFRALGRFSWIFYYIFTVYSAFILYQLFEKLKAKNRQLSAYLLLVAVFVSWGMAAKYNVERATRGLFNENDKLTSNDEEFLKRFEDVQVDYHQFQAIFALPFASTCGDKLLFENGMSALGEAMKCSHHTGIPLLQSFSPRLSFSQALSSIQLLADSAIRKTRLDDMNDKPLLLICTKQELNEQEQWLQGQAQVFWEDQYITMSTLPLSVFSSSHQNWLTQANDFSERLTGDAPIHADTLMEFIYYDGFEAYTNENTFTGEGALFKRRGELEIFDQTLTLPSGTAELSFWLAFDTRHYDMPQPVLTVWDEDGNQLSSTKLNNRQTHDVYQQWVRISTNFEVHNNARYQLSIKGKYIGVDDLLIKPAGANVLIRKSRRPDLFNNFVVHPQKNGHAQIHPTI